MPRTRAAPSTRRTRCLRTDDGRRLLRTSPLRRLPDVASSQRTLVGLTYKVMTEAICRGVGHIGDQPCWHCRDAVVLAYTVTGDCHGAAGSLLEFK